MALRTRSRHEEETQETPPEFRGEGPDGPLTKAIEEGGPLDTSAEDSGGNGADHSPEQSTDAATSTGSKKKSHEEKSANFSRIGSVRVSAVLKALRPLETLANTSQYAWTEEQEDRIFGTLKSKIAELEAMFEAARVPVIVDGKRKSNRQLLFRV